MASVVSDSVRPHRRQPTRLPHPRDSPGKNTGVGCHFLLQCMKVKVNMLSCVRLLATPWTAAYQAPPSMGFSRQEYWTGLPLPSPNNYYMYIKNNPLFCKELEWKRVFYFWTNHSPSVFTAVVSIHRNEQKQPTTVPTFELVGHIWTPLWFTRRKRKQKRPQIFLHFSLFIL